jgi:NADH:ubiquinone oxidoreductase subunit 5 (subunit L)/multisubunit Na+/H+ antiporter MnhA subunit
MYKSGLFLTAGSVEKQTGTTDLHQLGGLGRRMPVTFLCFFITAASISGVPPFNGFFSKELVYDGALERSWIFYAGALLGSFLTAASFLKLGHAVYFGKDRPQNSRVKESSAAMLIPMLVIAGMCVLFGLWNALPLRNLIQPILGEKLEGHDYAGWKVGSTLLILTLVTLGAAILNHIIGVRSSGSGLGAVDHIHHAPGLAGIYNKAERGFFDPYNWGVWAVNAFSKIAWGLDRFIDWIISRLVPGLSGLLSSIIRAAHTGDYALYVIWSLAGAIMILWFMAKGN